MHKESFLDELRRRLSGWQHVQRTLHGGKRQRSGDKFAGRVHSHTRENARRRRQIARGILRLTPVQKTESRNE